MKVEILKKKKPPDKPGVYFFKHKGKILYIGKATSLRDRTKSYFSKDLIVTRGPIIADMIFKADKIDWQETDSVLEALILEANLIKKHQPRYNTDAKDDKSFNYVCITKPARTTVQSGGETLPKVITVRGKNLQPELFYKTFGPYPHGAQLREALKIVRRIFPFLDEKSKNYLEFYKQINLAPDLNDLTLYKQNIRNIILFFSGKKKQVFRNLKKEMNVYSKNREFEKAGEIKRQIFALQHINDIALLKSSGKEQENLGVFLHPTDGTFRRPNSPVPFRVEAYDIAHMGGKNMTGVMTVVEDGEVNKNEYRKFKIRTQTGANDTGALREVLERRFTHPEWQFPSLIAIDGSVAQINAAEAVLAKLNLKIPIVAVVKDERHKPKGILGDGAFASKYKREILLANSEAHRFAIAYHKNMRGKNFLK